MNQSNSSAVARREADGDSPLKITSVGQRDEVERFEAPIILPPTFQYVIPGRKKVGNDWQNDNKVGITSDGYDYLNRALGATFWLPPMVHDSDGEEKRNPIHRRDYIYLRMGAVWYNAVGQLVSYVEDLEVDYIFVYQQARLESPGATVAVANGMPQFDDNGFPVIEITDHQYIERGGGLGNITTAGEQEKKALKALMQLRTMGMRYAQTVLRTRLLKVAIGVKSLPLQQPQDYRVTVVGYKDKLDPQARIERAENQLAALYGRQPEAKPLTAAELAGIDGGDVETDVDQSVLFSPADTTEPDEFDVERAAE